MDNNYWKELDDLELVTFAFKARANIGIVGRCSKMKNLEEFTVNKALVLKWTIWVREV